MVILNILGFFIKFIFLVVPVLFVGTILLFMVANLFDFLITILNLEKTAIGRFIINIIKIVFLIIFCLMIIDSFKNLPTGGSSSGGHYNKEIRDNEGSLYPIG